MNFKEGKCPKCLGILQVPDNIEEIICMYCGSKLPASEVIKEESHSQTKVDEEQIPLNYEKSLDEAFEKLPKLLLDLENPLQAFKKDQYESYFRNLYDTNEDMLHNVWQTIYYADDKADIIGRLAKEFVSQASQVVDSIPKKGAKEQKLMDFNLSLAVYVVPLILEYKNKAMEELADKILEEWKAKFPKTNVGKSDFENIFKGFRKKLCYITTAVCETLGKGDDCYELTLLRHYRDHFLLNQPDGEEVISEYYNIAPTIVKRINKLSNAKEVYQSVWDNYLNPCVKLIEDNKNMECKDVYYKMVRDLQKEYCYE
ncbi:MAG: hypothetical protein H2184_02075 [Candidatus Galacturonibacter soehngenii]|nr:hypothetical protein [Candidatus Galacturonibacter soehngenii]